MICGLVSSLGASNHRILNRIWRKIKQSTISSLLDGLSRATVSGKQRLVRDSCATVAEFEENWLVMFVTFCCSLVFLFLSILGSRTCS
eukprot:s204_g19.t1